MKKSIKIFLLSVTGLSVILLGMTWATLSIYGNEVRLKAELTLDKTMNATVAFDTLSISFLKDFPNMETLAGTGQVRISHAKINGMKIFEELSRASKKQEVNNPHLKDFVMDSDIRDTKIIVKPFSIKVSGFDTNIEGVSEIRGPIRYLVRLGLPPLGIKIPFHVTGTYSNPKVVIGKGHVLHESDSLPN